MRPPISRSTVNGPALSTAPVPFAFLLVFLPAGFFEALAGAFFAFFAVAFLAVELRAFFLGALAPSALFLPS